MLSTLAEKIHDSRFLRLVRNMLQAGYLEDWVYHVTFSGTPQGGVASPVLSNIYLHKLDRFVETVLIPQHNRGTRRARNPAYLELAAALARARRRGDRAQARKLRQRMRGIPSTDPHDLGYRRLRYCRYADDTLLGFTGPKAEAENIKQRLAQFLHEDLTLELSQDKTLITHARTGAARFLGYDITVQHNDRQLTRGQRHVNGHIALRVPPSVIKAKCAPYRVRGKPARRTQIINRDDYHIVTTYGAEYRGIVQYYLLAGDVYRLHRLRWAMQASLLATLASKHRSTVTKIAAKHQAKITTPLGLRTCYEAIAQRAGKTPLVARFGGIPLTRHKTAVITDRTPTGLPYPRKELINRLLNGRCELCQQPGQVQVHQVRKLTDLNPNGSAPPPWARLMARRRRKTLVVCADCHDHIHTAKPTAHPTA
jgi:Reverse transcriptase (RNA-dependent DNA polymerase)/Type II intron maturase